MSNGVKGRTQGLLRDIIGKLDAVEKEPPLKLEEGMRDVELALVDLREHLIDAVHAPGDDPELRAHLDQVNTAITLVIALEYPVSDLQRGKIKEARDVLKTLCPASAGSR